MKNKVKLLIEELKLVSSKSLLEDDISANQRIQIIKGIETELLNIPDYLWDTMITTTDFEISSNQYSMF